MKKTNQYLYWAPRILSIAFILFLMMFSLDVFDMGLGFWETALGLLMHNIPTLILAAALAVAWKYEIVGGIAFFGAGLVYICLLLKASELEWGILIPISLISGPAFLVGILFLIGWYKRKR